MVSTGRQGCVMMATLEWILVNARRLVCVRATCKQARRSVSPTSVFSLFFFYCYYGTQRLRIGQVKRSLLFVFTHCWRMPSVLTESERDESPALIGSPNLHECFHALPVVFVHLGEHLAKVSASKISSKLL